jgi:membrane associated rhomboid family serine protease
MLPHPAVDSPTRFPVVTATVVALTAFGTMAGLGWPPVLEALARRPGAFQRGQVWRIVTPMFVHAPRPMEIAVNLLVLAGLGAVAERRLGPRLWLLVYFASGMVGELAGNAWKPTGAGCSVGFAGLLGAIVVALLVSRISMGARVALVGCLLGAVALSVAHDLHGPPVLAGALLTAAVRGVMR